MIKVANIFLPKSIYTKIDKLENRNQIEYQKSIKNIIRKEYDHVLNVCRYGYEFDFKYCAISKSLTIEVRTNDHKVYFIDL